jgi:RNA polymerase sigma-70 factor, ECF subfamily
LADLLPDDPDRGHVRAAAAGDMQAFEALVRKYQSRMVSLAASLGGGQDAEDLAQEVFVRVYKALRAFRADSSFRTWLYTVGVNVARSYRARRRRQQEVWGDSGADDTRAFEAAGNEDFESAWITRDAIQRALRNLPEDLRLAVTLRDVHGLDYKEIATTTGAPLGTVESRIFRARQRLRAALRPVKVQ